MITLITGQPGAGKTLFAISSIRDLAAAEKRPVFYSGITGLAPSLGWIELADDDPWFNAPTGAIIVIDECQRKFRPRSVGVAVPEEVARMETHRHAGHDLFLLTQHPMLLDTNVRRLVGRHIHVMRAFGSKSATLHEWAEVREMCDKRREGSIRTTWVYPKEVFELYKSAEVHTHKARVPLRFWLALLIPVVVGLLMWGSFRWLSNKAEGKEVAALGKGSAAAAPGAGPSVPRLDYFSSRQPRVVGVEHTAPVYDDVTKPVRAPVPVGCVETSKGCACYTQQGTRYATEAAICKSLLAGGFFVSWHDADSGAKQEREERKQ